MLCALRRLRTGDRPTVQLSLRLRSISRHSISKSRSRSPERVFALAFYYLSAASLSASRVTSSPLRSYGLLLPVSCSSCPALGFSDCIVYVYVPPAETRENCMDTNASNQSMKPTAPLRGDFRVFATTPCRGLSLSPAPSR